MSKRRKSEVEFGSDSFLDVIANIVGILIILVVTSGMRTSSEKLEPFTASLTPATPVMSVQPSHANPAFTLGNELPAAYPLDEFAPPALAESSQAPVIDAEPSLELPAYPVLAAPAAPQDLVQQATELEARLIELKQQLSTATEATKLEQSQSTRTLATLEEVKAKAADAVSALHRQQVQLKSIEQQLQEKQSAIARFQVAIDAKKEAASPVEELQHQLTPIGKSVDGDELHFRLEGNRVSHVPVLELAGLVKEDIERRKEIVFTRSFYKGTVGPRDGYKLEYLVQRESGSLAGDLRYGAGVVRIMVSNWVISPDRTLETETLEQANQPDSRFVRALRRAKGGTTITLWVYPDSFEIHRQLKELIHNTGFAVASRPLPPGVPIAGSPDGSRSVSQ